MRFRRIMTTAAAGAAVAGTWVAAQPAPAAQYFTLRIVAINRAGHDTATQPVVTGNQPPISSNGQVFKVAPGLYTVGAAVATPIPYSSQPSYTLIARTVTVSRNTTLILDARTGKLLKVAFNVRGARQVIQGAALCDGVGIGGMLAGVYDDPTGTTYVAPPPKAVQLYYQSRWQSGDGTLYDLGGAAPPGSKAAPDFRSQLSELAKVHLQLRTGTSGGAAPATGLLLDYGANCSPGGEVLPAALPWGATDYMQAGSWSAQVDIGDRALWWDGAYRAGHTYSLTFGSAVAGPWLPYISGLLFPDFTGQTISFDPLGFFSDPVAQADAQCSGRITSTLSRGGHVVKTARGDLCGGALSASLSTSGWYQLTVTGTQASELSPKVTINWRFYAKTEPVQSWPVAFPVTLTEFRAGGLNLGNAAAPGAKTPIVAQIVKGAYPDSPTPRNVIRSVRIQASFDGGKTWHQLALTHKGSYWTAEVRDPASGFVSLRSVVTNTAGDSTTQTFYDAYAIQ